MKLSTWAIVLFVAVVGIAMRSAPAAAQSAPTAGPVRALELEYGHFLGLSPDGAMYAVAWQGDVLCTYDTATTGEIGCGSIERLDAGLRLDDVAWSPDSSKLAFAENAFVTGDDGDLWVMDAQSGAITNLTDDGFAGSLFSFGDESENRDFFIDIAPAWTPDSQFITFSRSSWEQGERTGNRIAQIAATGGEVEVLATVSDEEPGIVYFGGGWSPDGATFYFSVSHMDPHESGNGIWTYDRATGETALFAAGDDPDLGPLTLLQVSPAGDQLLAWYPVAYGQFKVGDDLLRLVDTKTGALSTPALPLASPEIMPGVTLAAFSPDGQALVLVIRGVDIESQLWVTDLTSGEQTLLVEQLPDAGRDQGLMPSWSANGAVGVDGGIGGGYLTSISGVGLDQTASSTPAVTPESFAAGSNVTTAAMAPLFAAPDPAAPVVLVLAPNRTVQILAAPVENAFGRWYPVIDPDTQTIGYVQANRLTDSK